MQRLPLRWTPGAGKPQDLESRFPSNRLFTGNLPSCHHYRGRRHLRVTAHSAAARLCRRLHAAVDDHIPDVTRVGSAVGQRTPGRSNSTRYSPVRESRVS